MFTENENKIVKTIVNGKTKKNRTLTIIILLLVFLAISLFALHIKNRAKSELNKVFEGSNTLLSQTKTSTRLEQDLKFMVSKADKDIQDMTLDLVDLRFIWLIIWLVTLLTLIILSFNRDVLLEKIIKKYYEDKEIRRA
jgi:hypothetical protein